MEKGTIIIRAAGLSRLIKTIHSVTSDNPEFLYRNTETKDIFEEIVKNETIAMFYTEDVELLAKLFVDIVKFYKERPVIYSKITLLWGVEQTGFLLRGKVESRNPRSKEVKELSNAFYALSESVQDTEVSATVEFTKTNDATFHSDSEYVKFTVKM